MISRLLIANRAEIAVRIIRACQQMGIETVAAFSAADRCSMAVEMADEAVCIGGASSTDSCQKVQCSPRYAKSIICYLSALLVMCCV